MLGVVHSLRENEGVKTLEEIGAVPSAEMRGALAGCARGLPVTQRGGTIRAFAMVDPEDFKRLSIYKWHLNSGGYVGRNIRHPDGEGQSRLGLHRAVVGLVYGDKQTVDHISHDLLDNRKANLRITSHAENCQNRAGGYAGSKSKHRGVSLRKDRTARPWQAYARADGKQNHIGFFETEDEAAQAAAAFRAEHMPFTTN